MPRNANGIYSLPSVYQATPGTTIRSEQHNVPFEDVAQALTNSLPRDGAAPMTGALNMGLNRINQLGLGVSNTDAARMDQVTPRSAFLLSASALSLAANEMVYASGANVAAKTALTAFARTLLDDADAATARGTLGVPPDTRTVTAGNGLTGGGDLSANRTLAMGTPGSVTGSSTNSVSATSHSHELDLGSLPLKDPDTEGQTPRLLYINGNDKTSLAQIGVFNLRTLFDIPNRLNTISAGNGLVGGGDLTANRTISADYATQAEAQGGTNNVKLMTPLRVKQAIDSLTPTPQSPIGVGQTWGSYSRSIRTVYQNTTGRPIQAMTVVSGGAIVQVSPDGTNWITVAGIVVGIKSAAFIIPANWRYKVERESAGETIYNWAELR